MSVLPHILGSTRPAASGDHRVPVALFLVTLFGLPLIVNPTVAQTFEEILLWPKVLWIYGALAPSALYMVWTFRSRLGEVRPWLCLLGAWLGWLTLATLNHDDRLRSLLGPPDRADGLTMHAVYALTALAAGLWHREEGARAEAQMGAALAGLAVALALVVGLQRFGLVGVIGADAMTGVIPSVAGGTLGNRGYMGGLLALLLPIAAERFRRTPSGSHVVVLGLTCFGVCTTMTRGAWLAAAAGYVVWVWASGQWRSWRSHGLLASAIALAVLFPGIEVRDTEELSGDSGRTVLTHSALYGITRRPLLGWGADGLLAAMRKRPGLEALDEYGVPPGLDGLERRLVNDEPHTPLRFAIGTRALVVLSINKVHDEFLDYAVSYGLPAAALFALILILACLGAWRNAPAYAAAVVAYAVYLMTWPDVARFAPIAWALVGAGLASGKAAIRIPCPWRASVRPRAPLSGSSRGHL